MSDWHDIGARADYPAQSTRVCELDDGDSVLVLTGSEPSAPPKAYYNVCPHQGRSLEFAPGKVLRAKSGEVICAAHGATFVPDTGECIAGPCQGSALRALEVRVEQDRVLVKTED